MEKNCRNSGKGMIITKLLNQGIREFSDFFIIRFGHKT